ncbi:ABC transporter permease [Gordonia araii NBRC 100433]|nr:ABC transporter permease [Gordonia araii NBRC 100433]
MVGRSLRHTVRNIDALLTAVFLPVMMLVLFTVVFGGAMDTGQAYIDYVVPGVILLCAGFGAASTAISVTKDMTEGIVARFRTMNIVPSAVLAGHVTASVARNLVSTALVLATALLLGFRPSASPSQWLGAIGLVVLFIVAMSWFSAMVGLVAKTVDAAAALGFFVLFLPYASSAFVPIDTMPGWLQPIATHQPITPIIETLRALLHDVPTGAGSQAWTAVAWCLGITVASIAGCVVLWNRSRGR